MQGDPGTQPSAWFVAIFLWVRLLSQPPPSGALGVSALPFVAVRVVSLLRLGPAKRGERSPSNEE